MEFRVIGLMSGTSLDGLDICFSKFSKSDGGWKYEILETETIPYSREWEDKLRNSTELNSEDLLDLNSEYGYYLGEKVANFRKKYSLKEVDLISSHGHTVFHQPERKFTLQIGDGRAIKILNDFPVVYDFRSQDVILGGNGAPLVPIGDQLLFSEFDACLNIGGFSNISFEKDNKRIAFDICPVNIVLNGFAKKLGKEFDENGNFAQAGIINSEILSALNSLSFYQIIPPKSLGIEWVNEHVFPLLQEMRPEDILATFTEHAAQQIAKILDTNKITKVLCTGGGTFNQFLLEKIRHKTNTQLIVPENDLINFKEALIFGFMGVLRINNEINILSSSTGSSADHISGILI